MQYPTGRELRNHPCAGLQMKDAGRWDPHLEELREAGAVLAVGNRSREGKKLIRALVFLLCYCQSLCSRAPKCLSTALINKFLQSIFNMNMWCFPSPNIMHSSLCPKQAQKLNYFNSSSSAQKRPAQTPQKETVWHILYFRSSIYLCPKLSSHSPLISISYFPHWQQYPYKSVPQLIPIKMLPALHLPCLLQSFTLEYFGSIIFSSILFGFCTKGVFVQRLVTTPPNLFYSNEYKHHFPNLSS